MGVLQRFERRVSDAVNGAFARAFKSEVQPVEIASGLQRECDNRAAIVTRGRTMVPNIFAVELSSIDHERLSVYCDPLCEELAEMVRQYAAEQRYAFVGPVTVTLERHDDLDTGMFRVRSTASAASDPELSVVSDGSPYLVLDGGRFALTSPSTVVGRGIDVDVRIDDSAVSRRHAEVRLQPHDPAVALVVDLQSTNGTFLDGRRVPQAELRDGDTVVFGSTSVVFRAGSRAAARPAPPARAR